MDIQFYLANSESTEIYSLSPSYPSKQTGKLFLQDISQARTDNFVNANERDMYEMLSVSGNTQKTQISSCQTQPERRYTLQSSPRAITYASAAIEIGRQLSDNGPESGIGSDSDSGNSAVFFDANDNTVMQTIGLTPKTELFHNQDIGRTSSENLDISHFRCVYYKCDDGSTKDYEDLAIPLDSAFNLIADHSSGEGVRVPIQSASSAVLYHDSVLSVKGSPELNRSHGSEETRTNNQVRAPHTGVFRDTRRQLSFERNAPTSQPARRPLSIFKRSISSDNRPKKLELVPPGDLQQQLFTDPERDQRTRIRSGLHSGDCSPIQAAVEDNNWLLQKNLSRQMLQMVSPSHHPVSSPTAELQNSKQCSLTVSGSGQDASYTPEQLRRQCESLQMRLSQDFTSSPYIRHSSQINEFNETASDQSNVAGAIAAKKQFKLQKYSTTHAERSESYNFQEFNYNDMEFTHSVHRTAVELESSCLTPTKQFSGSVSVPNAGYDTEQPATLPRTAPRSAPVMKYAVGSPGKDSQGATKRDLFNWRSGIAEAKRRWAMVGQQGKAREAVKTVGYVGTVVYIPAGEKGEKQKLDSQSTELDRSTICRSSIEERLRTPIRLRKNRSVANSPQRGTSPNPLVRGLSATTIKESRPMADMYDRQTSAPVGVTWSTSHGNVQSRPADEIVTHKPPMGAQSTKINGRRSKKTSVLVSNAASKKKKVPTATLR